MERRLARWTIGALVAVAAGLGGGDASAHIFRYTKPDGTVAYTDKLSDLPKERRAYYNRLLAELEKKNEEAEREAERDQAEIRKAEAERQRLERARIAARKRRERLAALDATIEALRERNRARQRAKEQWTKRLESTRRELDRKLKAYRTTKRDWQALAIQAEYALFPGQVKKKQELREKMLKLQREVDALVHELNVEIPEEARKAGVPPGWLRE